MEPELEDPDLSILISSIVCGIIAIIIMIIVFLLLYVVSMHAHTGYTYI